MKSEEVESWMKSITDALTPRRSVIVNDSLLSDMIMALGVVGIGIALLFFFPFFHAIQAWNRRGGRTYPRLPLRPMPDGFENCPSCGAPRLGGMIGLHECAAAAEEGTRERAWSLAPWIW